MRASVPRSCPAAGGDERGAHLLAPRSGLGDLGEAEPVRRVGFEPAPGEVQAGSRVVVGLGGGQRVLLTSRRARLRPARSADLVRRAAALLTTFHADIAGRDRWPVTEVAWQMLNAWTSARPHCQRSRCFRNDRRQ
jgi:hypothetical protein